MRALTNLVLGVIYAGPSFTDFEVQIRHDDVEAVQGVIFGPKRSGNAQAAKVDKWYGPSATKA